MKCASRDSLYTFTGEHYCDGWAGISLEECEAKCTNNDAPSVKCPGQKVPCEFVQYYYPTKWCHLGDSTCKPTKTKTHHKLLKKAVKGKDIKL